MSNESKLGDELSIDSKTDKKIQINVDANKKQRLQVLCPTNDSEEIKSTSTMRNDKSSSMASPRPHFRIDWRQLTYFKKEPRSLVNNLFCFNDSKRKVIEHNEVMQLKHHHQNDELLYGDDHHEGCDYEDFDELDVADEVGSIRLSSDCGGEGRSLSPTSQSNGPATSIRMTTANSPRRARRQPILNSLDGCFKSGELSAILGPSGAGKSTFLSALFGNKQESSYGQTKVTWLHPSNAAGSGTTTTTDGRQSSDLPAPNTKRSIRIASLPQQDHLLNHLTVYETLMFASKLKNPHKRNSSDSFHRANVRRVAKTLKLSECLQTRCGRLSGGQYKRVSIGQELLSEPDVIILDEPTSGLDAMTCLTTIRTLKSIVLKHPISIILTIHQPDLDVFNLFDHVYVIAQGGVAIYEGPPSEVAPTLAQVGLKMPHCAYNPARFIVENAFVSVPETSATGDSISYVIDGNGAGELHSNVASSGISKGLSSDAEQVIPADSDDDDEDLSGNEQFGCDQAKGRGVASNFLRQSLSSITGALKGEVKLETDGQTGAGLVPGRVRKFRDSGRKPLLNIGIQTADGKLVTSDQLVDGSSRGATLSRVDQLELRRQTVKRWRVLRRLNAIQKGRYYNGDTSLSTGFSFTESDLLSQQTRCSLSFTTEHNNRKSPEAVATEANSPTCSNSPPSSSSSSSWTVARDQLESEATESQQERVSLRSTIESNDGQQQQHFVLDLTSSAKVDNLDRYSPSTIKCETRNGNGSRQADGLISGRAGGKLRRQFDKRLSSKRIHSKGANHPIWHHSFLLTHRTWLSIVRDPVFFGIQFAMHTTIPILLALIFGSSQEEGCPRTGNFDLVEFAYADEGVDFMQGSIGSIRKSIGNIGVVFFEMFTLSFAINCITALVFPLDMHVLLKEHRNGWYSLKSYFFARTLADLPVPIVLHSMAMSILCYMTSQPLSWWRFSTVIGIVIVASLVAQSIGLTIGALLMRSSQSAVLAAAGIVAPFFALSGFIVRIHTLPTLAQMAAQGSYLYHLINGFIIMRYGFGKCPCSPDDFQPNQSHQIPANLRTMASMWIGTYSDEFETSNANQMNEIRLAQHQVNRTNLDPNIDVIEKLLNAFKMANSFGHKVENCDQALPYAMLDFNLHDDDIWYCCLSLVIMLVVTRFITFSAIYYKIRSFS